MRSLLVALQQSGVGHRRRTPNLSVTYRYSGGIPLEVQWFCVFWKYNQR